MSYNIDKGEYICTCKAQRAEYFPCHDGNVECKDCGYAKAKVLTQKESDEFIKNE